jgi:hypothetical protein
LHKLEYCKKISNKKGSFKTLFANREVIKI